LRHLKHMTRSIVDHNDNDPPMLEILKTVGAAVHAQATSPLRRESGLIYLH
jgi:hypothetical protein